MPGTYKITGYRGDTLTRQFTFTDTEGVPLVLPTTGWRAQLRRTPTDATAVSFTVDSSAGATGVITITLSAVQTTDAVAGVWDLEHAAGGVVTTYVAGAIVFEQDVTR